MTDQEATKQVLKEALHEWQTYLTTDEAFLRVLDELIDLLVSKRTITLADLSVKARQKHAQRRALR